MTHVLVIEDDHLILDNVLEVLELEGFDAIGAGNGQVGIEKIDEAIPDIILCDIMMPVMNGYDVLKKLQEKEVTATIPFIFLTAVADRTSMRHGMEMGADDYVTKPFTPGELIAAIEARLGKRKDISNQHTRAIEQLRKNMAYALPHELRTPLTGLMGCGELLSLDYDNIKPDKIQQIAEVITQSTSRLHRLIENYLYYTKVELLAHDEAKLAQAREHVTDFPDGIIMEVAVNHAQAHGRDNDIELDVNPGRVKVRHEDLYRIVFELVDNAIKFSNPSKRISISAGPDDDNFYTIHIKDCGRGMTNDQIQAIGAYIQFDRDVYEQQGMGLGLAIVKRLASIYDGQFIIKSDPGGWTQVTLRLPIALDAAHQTASSNDYIY